MPPVVRPLLQNRRKMLHSTASHRPDRHRDQVDPNSVIRKTPRDHTGRPTETSSLCRVEPQAAEDIGIEKRRGFDFNTGDDSPIRRFHQKIDFVPAKPMIPSQHSPPPTGQPTARPSLTAPPDPRCGIIRASTHHPVYRPSGYRDIAMAMTRICIFSRLS